MAPKCDAMLVVGARIRRIHAVSSRLDRVRGARMPSWYSARTDIDWRSLEGITSIGITAGASAPEQLDQRSNRRLQKTATR